MVAEIKEINQLPTIVADGKPITQMAYITYCLDNNRYSDFANIGVKLYSVNLNFSEMPINERAPVIVLQKGIFEGETPDFSIIDRNFDQIFEVCPDAYIFPRVNMNLPESWEKSHPDELCEKGFNERKRFSYASDLWAEEVKSKLTQLVKYIENSPYKDRIIGYQLAAGNTEEWLAIDPQSGYGKRAHQKFLNYCDSNKCQKNAESYYNFMSELIADRIGFFAAEVKKLTNREKLVGAFYGYTLFVGRDNCHNALGKLLECPDLDFLCSPVSYAEVRAAGIDPYAMVPTDSLRLHKKLYFSENDIRTHLSKPLLDHPNYTLPIWYGHEKNITIEQLKLSFCRAMLHGYGMWWFDMWGGWYDDADYMAAMSKMREICQNGMDSPDSDIAVFIDEKAITKGVSGGVPMTAKALREIGLCGTPYDAYLMSDFQAVSSNYKACIFIEPAATELSEKCAAEALAKQIAVMRFTVGSEISAEGIRNWLKVSGCQMPANKNAVVYRGKKYIMLYAPEDGEYDFEDRESKCFTDLFSKENFNFPTNLKKAQCLLFERR